MRKNLLIVLGIIGLSACSKSDVVYSSEYYQNHISEATEQLKVCQTGGTTQIQQTNCQNATQALMWESLKNRANKPFKGSGL